LPEGVSLLVCDPAVLYANLWDELINKEYYRVPDYVAKKGQIIFDIGAHIGLYTLRNAKRVGKYGKVYAFEPNPITYYYLKRNIDENSICNVSVFPIALSDKNGHNDLFIPLDKNLGATSFFIDHLKKESIKRFLKVRVPTVTLDKFIEDHGLSRIDLMKIDVEGAETKVLLGGRRCLTQGVVKRLIIEVHKDVFPVERIIQMLHELNFYVDYIFKCSSNVKSIVYAQYLG